MSQYSDSSFSEDPNSSWFKVYNYIKAGSTVLDIGCSSGNFGRVLIDKKKCVVDGIELDEADCKVARKKLRKVFCLNVETDDLSVIEEKYDYMYFGDVIEHLVTPIPTLRRVQKLLKPTGKLIFSIPNMSHISVRLMLLEGQFKYGRTGLLDTTHLHFYTHSEIQRIFTESGYVITDLDPVVKDYPKELLAEKLKAVGLKSTKEFRTFVNSTEASVYQFVGMVEVQKSKKRKSKELDIVSPVDEFQTYLDETKEYYEAAMKDDKKHIAKQQKALEEYAAVIRKRDEELAALRSHPVVKALRGVKRLMRG